MSEDRWEVPDLESELVRKVVETYDWIMERSGAGDMTESEVKVALQTVFNVTCGLIPKDVTDAAEVVQGSARANAVETIVLQGKDDGLVVLRWEVGACKITCEAHGDRFHHSEREEETPALARAKFHQLAAGLVNNNGFKRI